MNDFLADYPREIKAILDKYPAGHQRSAVMPLLFLAQRKEGYIRDQALTEISQILDIQKTEVATLVGFYTLFHDQEAGSYRIQVCTDLCCALRGAEEFLEALCTNLEIEPGETTKDGMVTIEAVKCLAACDKAPMFQVQGENGISYHENCDLGQAVELIASWRNKETTAGEDAA